MSGAMTALATAGWTVSAALALVLARRGAADRARGDTFAAVLHELRGPLHAAGLILAGARRSAGPGAAPALGALEVELGRLVAALGDLQGLGPCAGRDGRRPRPLPLRWRWRTGRGRGRRGPAARGGGGDGRARAGQAAERPAAARCDVAALVRDLAPGWRLLAADAGRRLRVQAPLGACWVAGDRVRLAQALGNLVANALEHGRGDVGVHLGGGPAAGTQVEVRDAGPGLPATVAALVDRPADPGRPRGRGLGIAARIADDVGGRLRSAPAARGARLVLDLPAAPAPDGAAAAVTPRGWVPAPAGGPRPDRDRAPSTAREAAR